MVSIRWESTVNWNKKSDSEIVGGCIGIGLLLIGLAVVVTLGIMFVWNVVILGWFGLFASVGPVSLWQAFGVFVLLTLVKMIL